MRVLSLNIWHDAGPWEARRAAIRSEIARVAPDLIGFQEVLKGEGVDLAAEIVEGLGYETEFVGASEFWGRKGVLFGNAVASRHPIRSRSEVRLPDADDGERRAALTVRVETPFGEVSCTSTHLNWKFHHGNVRERQVLDLCEHVREQRPKGGFPPILVGDFNADPDSAEIRYVSGLQSLEGRSVHFVDAWRHAGDGGPGVTWSNDNEHARAWLEPDRRIDYVFVGPPRRPDGLGHVLHCARFGAERVDGAWCSDHFGVVADLRHEPIEDPGSIA